MDPDGKGNGEKWRGAEGGQLMGRSRGRTVDDQEVVCEKKMHFQ